MNEKPKPMFSRLYEVTMPGYKTTVRAVSEEHARVWAEIRYLKLGFKKEEIQIKEVPGEEEPLPPAKGETPEKSVLITESQVEAIRQMMDALFMQRSTYDMENGTDKEVLDKGEAAVRKLQEALKTNQEVPEMSHHDEI